MTLDYFYGQAGKLFSFYRIPKALFQEQRFQNLSTDAKTLYGILLDRMSLSVKNEWFDKQGRVFIIFTIEDVKRALCCADNKATKLLRELENFGLIERKRRGLGKPSLVYVKNFSSDLSNERFQNRENHESGSPKNACQDPPKSRCNKNKKSKTERNNTNPILSDELEKMKNRKLLEEYFSCSLEIELLLRLYPDDEDTIYQIVDLLVDTCDSKRKLIRIAGDDKPAEVVLSRLKKLNADHIRFVLDCLAANTSPIRNQHVANEPKVSFRNSQFIVTDGQHTIEGRILRNGGKDLPILCKVYTGMTVEQEALLFAEQNGFSAPLTAGIKLRAKVVGGDAISKAFLAATNRVGLSLNYDSQQLTDYRIGCVGTAFRLYKQMGEPLYCETMRLIVAAWEGKPDSFRASVLKGMMHFVELYHGEFSEERLLRALRNIHPVDIYRIGQDDPAKLRGWKKYVFPIYTTYNGKCRKDALPMKF